MPTHVVRIDCPDRVGLVHGITGVLYRHGVNIISNSEFVDRETERFFMRSEFAGDPDGAAMVRELRGVLPPGAGVHLAHIGERDIVVLATREHHCLGELLLRHAFGELGARILAVVANHAVLEPLVRQFGIPFHCVSHEGVSRAEHEAAILDLLRRYEPEYLVLAKYMRVLSPDFVARYPQRIVNIHHSFLPAFVGAYPYRQAFERGVKIIGATAHIVTENLDEGPIIAQGVLPVDHTHGAADMARAGRDIEKIVLAQALRLVFEERVFLHGHRTVVL